MRHPVLSLVGAFAFLALWTETAPALSLPEPMPIADQNLRFSYSTSDGGFQLSCRHGSFEAGGAASHDWLVHCGEGTPTEREFFVHLLVRKYSQARKPEAAFEIHYWVTDRKVPNSPRFSSGTQWLRFEKDTELHSAAFSQSLENDAAFLMVEFLSRAD